MGEFTGGEASGDDFSFFFIPDGNDNSNETTVVELGDDLDPTFNEWLTTMAQA